MLIGSVVGMLSKNIDRRSMDSSRANLLALKAINLVLITFYKMLSPKLAHFQVDNTAVLSFLMKMGETGSREITALVKEIWKFALFQEIIITTKYLPGKLDVRGCPETFRNPGNDCCPPRCFK